MLAYLADENFNDDIMSALRSKAPDLDLVSVFDVGLSRTDDPIVLEWAAAHRRIVLSHDVNTLVGYAYDRVRAGLGMPGVFEIPPQPNIQRIVDDLILLAECSLEGEWEGQVVYLPLR